VNLICNKLYLNFNIWYCVLMCIDCVLASPRIAQANVGQQTPSPTWFYHIVTHEQGVITSFLSLVSLDLILEKNHELWSYR
jgi:hypothetical protein